MILLLFLACELSDALRPANDADLDGDGFIQSVDCDDGDVCTDDICNEQNDCENPPGGLDTDGDGTCDPLDVCPDDGLDDADDDGRLDPKHPFRGDLLEEVPKHHLGHVDIRDHTVLERTDRLDPLGRSPEHALRLEADPHDATAALLDGDHGGLVEDDALTLHVHEGIGRPEINGDVVDRDETPRVKPVAQIAQQSSSR